jgi:hypothetical protein
MQQNNPASNMYGNLTHEEHQAHYHDQWEYVSALADLLSMGFV